MPAAPTAAAEPPERAAAPAGVEILIEEPRWAEVAGLTRLPDLLSATLAAAGAPADASAVLALDCDATLRDLNARFRGQDRPTNVLSFPALAVARRQGQLGDVVLAFETCRREAEALGIAPGDHACHLAVHGLLHLLGHDHGTESEAHRMEALETRLLAAAGIADPYAGPEPSASRHSTDDSHD